jgi:hypothetical protein
MYQEILTILLQQLKHIAKDIGDFLTIWVALGGVIVALVGVCWALILGVGGILQDRIRALFRKPKLNVSIRLEPPDCHKIPIRHKITQNYVCDSYYFRFRVENDGNYQMEDVEAMVVEVHRKIRGKFEKMHDFLPLNLVWANYHRPVMPKIQPRMFKHLDFGYITRAEFADLSLFGIQGNPCVVFRLSLAAIPNTGSHILTPGDFKIRILFAANNLKPVQKIYCISIKDNWTDDTKEMLGNNVSIEEVHV